MFRVRGSVKHFLMGFVDGKRNKMSMLLSAIQFFMACVDRYTPRGYAGLNNDFQHNR